MEENKLDLSVIVNLAKRRGFVFAGSEIYGGLAGTFDYGPLGSLLKNNIKNSWLEYFIHQRKNIFLVDAAILMNARVWQATGHTEEFIDPLVEDVVTNKRYRADHLLKENGFDSEDMTINQMSLIIKEKNIKSPEGNSLGEVRAFNMMLETRVGAMADSSALSYLRPETAQGIFVNYKNVLDSMNPKIPFGVAQIGKAFRNEITPRDFIFRLRELEQMEIEYFIDPESDWNIVFDYWLEEQKKWLVSVGINENKLHTYEHPDNARSHYSKKTVDFEFEFPFGTKELSGLAHRSDFDLSRHSASSGQRLDYFEESSGRRFTPHALEPTFGLDRTFLAILCSCYNTEKEGDEERVFLSLPYHIAPFLIAVSPLVKNKPELVSKAQEIFDVLKREFGRITFDDNGNIGKRYRRQDEIGTPFCLVVDYDTLENKTVSIRNRDSKKQTRHLITDLISDIKKLIQT